MNQISIDQLKSRITVTVGIIVFAVICISALGVVTECTGVAGAGGLATERPSSSIAFRSSSPS